jgi:hypothetical protein
MSGFFFYAGASCTGQAHAVGGTVGEFFFEFSHAAPDGSLAQAGDLGDELNAAVAVAFGFEGGIPATLLFIGTAEDEIDLVMDYFVGVIGLALADRACTLMHAGHGGSSSVADGSIWRIGHRLTTAQISILFLDRPLVYVEAQVKPNGRSVAEGLFRINGGTGAYEALEGDGDFRAVLDGQNPVEYFEGWLQ